MRFGIGALPARGLFVVRCEAASVVHAVTERVPSSTPPPFITPYPATLRVLPCTAMQVIESKVEKRIIVVSSVADAKRIELPRPPSQRWT